MFTRNVRRVRDRRHGGPLTWPTQWGSEFPDWDTYLSIGFWALAAVASVAGSIALSEPSMLGFVPVCAVCIGVYMPGIRRRRRTLSRRITAGPVDPETGTSRTDADWPTVTAARIPGRRPVVQFGGAVLATVTGGAAAALMWTTMLSTGSFSAFGVLVALVATAVTGFAVVYAARLIANRHRVAIVAGRGTLWIHTVTSSHLIPWYEVTAVEPLGRTVGFGQTAGRRRRDRVTPRIRIHHGDRAVDVRPGSFDIDPAVLLHLLQTLHTSPDARAGAGTGEIVAWLADLYGNWSREYR